MFSIARHRRRSSTLISSATGIGLFILLGVPAVEAPTAPRPDVPAVQHGPSGKVVDRLPGNAPTAAHFAERLASASWMQTAPFGADIALASASWSDEGTVGASTEPGPVRVAVSKPATPPSKLARGSARPHGAAPVVAALPPSRPASLHLPPAATTVAAATQERPSVTARMIAFVGSLASLARPL
ncbi:conserved hypothetical protein [Hyphomicrobiales bacterium]|nr:conserved hypothetical protein [Hyphomicrobiales bacterium]CAH1697607.1 conserved hypothetical protein [Hyphomicrobiales bacterium]CAI0347254.1 conserved hypothetical protein [Hyphomicrobiales bacterium]